MSPGMREISVARLPLWRRIIGTSTGENRVMQTFGDNRPAVRAASLLLASLLLCLGWPGNGVAQSTLPPTLPPYTIEIHNSSNLYNIYPVIATPTNDVDEWLQAGFAVPAAKIKTDTYGHKFVYRIYIDPQKGIPPHGSASVTLPFYSQLVDAPNPTKPDQYIDWWNGGRLYLYENPMSANAPPPALVTDYDNDKKHPASPLTPGPTCPDCQQQPIKIFKSPVALPDNDPDQLTEYTLDAAITADGAPYKLVHHLVDYDISYVDHVYLPVAMEPRGNKFIGYVGTVRSVVDFRGSMKDFLAAFPGWPRYLNAQDKPFLRIPGAYNAILAGLHVTRPGAAIDKMKALWKTCTTTTDPRLVCVRIRRVDDFFRANYAKYKTLGCKPTVPLNEHTLLSHVYGWVPFNENCAGTGTNALKDTPGYSGTHAAYILLEYNPPGAFNPYVELVHGKKYLDMSGAYAFSIDDALGNMLEDGDGIIVAVGGTDGLVNPKPFDKTKVVHVNLGDPNPTGDPAWLQYGICTATPDQRFTHGALAFNIATVDYPCTVSLTDAAKKKYTFTLKTEPPYPAAPSTKPIDCSAATNPGWCAGVTAKTVDTSEGKQNYVEAPKSEK
jgi:hypothetical protein